MLRQIIISSFCFFSLSPEAQTQDCDNPKNMTGIWRRYHTEYKDSTCFNCGDPDNGISIGFFEFKNDGTMIYSGIRTVSSDSAAFTGKWSLTMNPADNNGFWKWTLSVFI